MSDARLYDDYAREQIAFVEERHDDDSSQLFSAELALIENATTARKREFATGRVCARRALAALGQPAQPILRGSGGAPIWPSGFTGSITHCAGCRAAAAARSCDVVALGIDAEPGLPVPDGVLLKIAAAEERDHLARLASRAPTVPWGRLLFSAKEAVYKAWFPVVQTRLSFQDVEILPSVEGTFEARLLREPIGFPHSLLGRWSIDVGIVRTSVVILR